MQDAENLLTPTAMPVTMRADYPETENMMESISAPNIPLATEKQGGQSLAFREEDDFRVFELRTKTVRWPILDDRMPSSIVRLNRMRNKGSHVLYYNNGHTKSQALSF